MALSYDWILFVILLKKQFVADGIFGFFSTMCLIYKVHNLVDLLLVLCKIPF